MIKKREANTRGEFKFPSLVSRRTFANNLYYDKRYICYHNLNVINDDVQYPYNKVKMHRHANQEIFGYMVQGSCSHIDSLNNSYNTNVDDIQFMSSGSGIWHEEANNTGNNIRYIQIWIKPFVRDTIPSYRKINLPRNNRLNKFVEFGKLLELKQRDLLYTGIFTQPFHQQTIEKNPKYMYIVTGNGIFNDHIFIEGDGFYIENESLLSIDSTNCEIFLYEHCIS